MSATSTKSQGSHSQMQTLFKLIPQRLFKIKMLPPHMGSSWLLMPGLCKCLQNKMCSWCTSKTPMFSPATTIPTWATSKKDAYPTGDCIGPCPECGEINNNTSHQTCTQCSSKAHEHCVLKCKSLTQSQTFYCTKCFWLCKPIKDTCIACGNATTN